eukprot:3883272-Prymnesium_polylepis.1
MCIRDRSPGAHRHVVHRRARGAQGAQGRRHLCARPPGRVQRLLHDAGAKLGWRTAAMLGCRASTRASPTPPS